MDQEQNHIGYELRKTDNKGEGVYATEDFKRNEIVMVGNLFEILKENDAWATQVGENKFIRRTGLSIKVNHSCSPNVGYYLNSSGGQDYIAFKDIKAGDEILADYAMGNYKIEHFPECLCKSHECRKSITGWKDLSKEKKSEYEGFVTPYLVEMDNKQDL